MLRITLRNLRYPKDPEELKVARNLLCRVGEGSLSQIADEIVQSRHVEESYLTGNPYIHVGIYPGKVG